MHLEPDEDKQYNFRFSGGGYTCPYCHSRTGWSYIRNYGKEYGVCFACGIKNYPNGSKTTADPDRSTPANDKHPVQYIPLQVVEKTLTAYHSNPFVQFLERTFGTAVAGRIVSQFKVGTARSGGTVFWYFDKGGFCRKPKVVFYDSDGHRIKNDPDRKPHCAGYTNAKGYTLPLFGEHQLNERLYPAHTPVVLVESEKTACVGYAFLPQYIWLASGGARSMNITRTAALNGRQVLILPDADQAGREGAQRTLHLLKRLGVAAQVKDLFLHKTDHTDLADHLLLGLQEDHDQTSPPSDRLLPLTHPMPEEETQSLAAVFSKHPLLWQLTEQFGLTITSAKRCYQYPSR